MPRAELTLSIPEGVWIGDLTRAYPETEFRILAALAEDEAGVGLVEVSGPDLEAVLRELQEEDEVVELSVMRHGDDELLVQIETTLPLLLFPMKGSGTPLELPFTIREGRAEWRVTAPRDRLSELGDQLREFDISFEVSYIYQDFETERLLTDQQARLVTAATERGYYDTPRTCSLTELADELDMAKSTCSEMLHRAEGKIIKQFLTESTETAAGHPSD